MSSWVRGTTVKGTGVACDQNFPLGTRSGLLDKPSQQPPGEAERDLNLGAGTGPINSMKISPDSFDQGGRR